MKLYINKDLYEFLKKKKNGEKIFIEGKSSETKLVSDLSKDYSSVVNSLE